MKQLSYNGSLLAFLTKFMQMIATVVLQLVSFSLVSTSGKLLGTPQFY